MLYRPNSDKAGLAEDYVKEYGRLHPDRDFELVNLDSVAGDGLAKLYGISNNPAILNLASDGTLLQMWQDEHLPLFNELDYYFAAR